MSRKSFSDDDYSGSNTLQNVSANLVTIKRMMGWGTTEMARQVGISDRHLDSLLRMSSNVTVLVLEQIAAGLGIPFLRLVGTRIVVRGHVSGSDFLKELRKESWQISSDDEKPPRVLPTRDAAPRKTQKVAKATAASDAPTGMEAIFQRLVDVQERLTNDQSRIDFKVDKLADQVQDLASAVRGQAASGVSAAVGAPATGRGTRGARKSKALTEEVPANPGKGRRGAAARTSTGTSVSKASKGRRSSDPDGDLFDRGTPEAPKRRGRPPKAEAARTTHEAALKSQGSEGVNKVGAPNEPKRAIRPYNRKK